MLVIHPKDRTTTVLSILYQGKEADILNQYKSKSEVEHALCHCDPNERIMMLGRGSYRGLFCREDDECDEIDRILVGRPHAKTLRRRNGNIIGIWCHAEMFARREGLHGLFSGTIISNKMEAEYYGIITLQFLIERENEIMFSKLRSLLDEGCPLHEIPAMMKKLKPTDRHSVVANINYENFYYL